MNDLRPIPHPRKIGQHIRDLLDKLAAGGAENVRVYKSKHIKVHFDLGGERFVIMTACTPRSIGDCITFQDRDLRRLLGDALLRRSGAQQ